MGDKNPIRTLGYYSKPSHEGYRNTIELLVGNNVVPLLSDTIRLVQNGCSFHGLRSEDLNQHLKDFLKLVDSLNLDGSITTWEYLTTHFLAQFVPPGRTAKLRNDILMLQQHHGESLSEAWTRRLRKMSAEKAWATIEELARYEDEGWNDLVASREGSLDYENPDIENLLGVMKCKVDTLMKEAISLMGRSESVFRMTSNTMYQLPLEPSRQEGFEDLVMNFILDQEEKVRQLEEYMCVIGSDFMQLSLEVVNGN
ncbi:zinc finger, CCHC-type containing protein [Tanacetum coccineum]